ncbi:TPA: hypothetical protein IAC10_13160 [Candidatus Scatousia excrementigallinarum]|uniref:Uncharacterized protein n=1 Tax=Candidatus Scatousia excrementigallinarum TaxID=2840935 RepID=A0A9D1JP11_9BACT|nr:hypothetical protein [Candidatus Scatousia excrementigallinarum]
MPLPTLICVTEKNYITTGCSPDSCSPDDSSGGYCSPDDSSGGYGVCLPD